MPQQYSGFTPDDEPDLSGFTPDESPTQPVAPKGLLQRWDENVINQPLSRQIKMNGRQVFDPAAAANYYDAPEDRREDDWKLPEWMPYVGGGSLKSLGAGMLEGAGNVIEGFTSPLNIATAGTASLATKGAGTIANAGRLATKGLSAPMVASGAARAGEGIRTGEYGDVGFGIAEMAGGAAGARIPKRAEAPLPVRQPAAPIVTPESMPVRPGRMEALAEPRPEIPIVNRESTPADYAMDNAHIQARGGEVSPQMEALARAEGPQLEVPPVLDPEAQALRDQTEPFNPATLEFVDPKTGEIVPAALAQPGDIPMTPEKANTPELDPDMIDSNERNAVQVSAAKIANSPEQTGTMKRRELAKISQNSYVKDASPELIADIKANGITKPIVLTQSRSGNNPDAFDIYSDTHGKTGEFEVLQGADVLAAAKALGIEDIPVKVAGNLPDQIAPETLGPYNAMYDKKTGARIKISEATTQDAAPMPVRPEGPQYTGSPVFSSKVSKARAMKAHAAKGVANEMSEGRRQTATVGNEPAPNPQVVASLQQRLQKAVENPDPATAPKDIESLIDEAIEVINNTPDGPEKQGLIRQVLGANKAFLTSYDFSAPGRQGKALILEKAWRGSLIPMFKAWGSKEAADIIQQSIVDHPSGYFKGKADPKTGKPSKSLAEQVGLDIASTEEAFTGVVSRAAQKIPGLARSSRAHTAFLNKLRSDHFVSMMEASKKVGLDPERNLDVAKKYATFINDATGRGSVNIGPWKLERNLRALNDVFFAPKNLAGQVRTWGHVLNPNNYSSADPVMRMQALKSLFAVAGMGLTVGQLASMAGAKVSNDPTNSDFRKIRIGETRIDPFGGYQQFPVAAMKFMLGETTAPSVGNKAGKTTDLTAGKWGQQTRGSVASRFFTNRLSPVGSFVWAWMSNSEFDGKPFEVKRALYERVLPIAAKDIAELAMEDPALAAVLAIPTSLGLVGAQHYSR